MRKYLLEDGHNKVVIQEKALICDDKPQLKKSRNFLIDKDKITSRSQSIFEQVEKSMKSYRLNASQSSKQFEQSLQGAQSSQELYFPGMTVRNGRFINNKQNILNDIDKQFLRKTAQSYFQSRTKSASNIKKQLNRINKQDFVQKNIKNSFFSRVYSSSDLNDHDSMQESQIEKTEFPSEIYSNLSLEQKILNQVKKRRDLEKDINISNHQLKRNKLNQYWDQQFDQQLKKANYIKKQTSYSSGQINNVPQHLDLKNDEEKLIYFDAKKQEDLDKINFFLTEEFVDGKIEEISKEVPMQVMLGTKSYIKSGMMVKKLENKLDGVGNEFYKRMNVEIERDYERIQRGAQMKSNIMSKLNLKNDADLALHLVKNHIDKKNFKKKRNNSSFLDQQQHNKKVQIFEQFNPYDDQSDEFFSSQKRRQTNSFLKNRSSFQMRKMSTKSLRSQKSILDFSHDERLVIAQNSMFLNQYSSYQNNLSQSHRIVNKEIEDVKKQMNLLYNPDPDQIEDVIDQNLEELLVQSDTYKNVQKGAKKRHQMQVIKENALKTTQGLQQNLENRVFRAKGIMKLFSGSKRDYLVNKFIAILKRKVQDKKDDNIAISNENLIKDVLKKLEYNQSLKQNPNLVKKEKKYRLDMQRREGVTLGAQEMLHLGKVIKANKEVLINNDENGVQNLLSQVPTPLSVATSRTSELKEQTEDDDSNMAYEQAQFMVNQVQKKVMNDFVQLSINQGQHPLPILSKIEYGELALINYKIDKTNGLSLSQIIPQIVPKKLTKLFLVEIGLDDEVMAKIIFSLSSCDIGFKVLMFMQNKIGPQTINNIQQYLIQSRSFRQVEKFLLKNDYPCKASYVSAMCNSFNRASQMLTQLRKLSLVRVGLEKQASFQLSTASANMKSLQFLNISGNGLSRDQLLEFFQNIKDKNSLKSFNISYNQGGHTHNMDLENQICEFLHFSNSILHFDMSGLGLSFESYKLICELGLRKSRTLISCHINEMGLLEGQMRQIWQILNLNDCQQLDDRFGWVPKKYFGGVNKMIYQKMMKDEKHDVRQYFLQTIKKTTNNNKIRVQEALQKPIINPNEKIVFFRHLGHLEMVNSHRWHQDEICRFCQKQTYCVFFWNKKLTLKNFQNRYYNHSEFEPINSQNSKIPLIAINNRVYQMVPLYEFIDRINFKKTRSSNIRSCNNEIEEARFQMIKSKIEEKFDKNDPNCWNILNQANEQKFEEDMIGWYSKLNRILGKNTFQYPIITKYGPEIESIYLKADEYFKKIARDTFVFATYLPDTEATKMTHIDIIIKHHSIQGVDYQRLTIPRLKNLSLNTLPTEQKLIKKVQEIRYFKKPSSVFSKWQQDSNHTINKCWENDKALSKISKFIKNQYDLKATYQVVRKYYENLRAQYLNQIAKPKSYPVIDWLDFVSCCHQWKIIDKNLTASDIDRIFIATNYEEEDLEENDDSSLCRFEFTEIIVRMARQKYHESGICSLMSDSVEKLIKEFIIPNSIEKMEYQRFRDEELWTLEVDDLMKQNLNAIDALYKTFALSGQKTKRTMAFSDAQKMMEQIDRHPDMPKLTERLENLTCVAYSLSKMTLVDEMAEFEKYNIMTKVEFYEFICRISHLICQKLSMTLSQKIEKILTILLPLAGQKFQPIHEDAYIESDSDYDDDIIQNIL